MDLMEFLHLSDLPPSLLFLLLHLSTILLILSMPSSLSRALSLRFIMSSILLLLLVLLRLLLLFIFLLLLSSLCRP